MISISKHIKISILTVIVFVFCVIFHYPPIFYITYAVMALHEAAHLVAAKCIGLRVDYIALRPFGLNLRLKNKIVNSLSDEVILYLSGPLFNALAALGAIIAYKYSAPDSLRVFYLSNITLFAVNLLPAMPLDGGILLKRIVSRRFGQRVAQRVSRGVSALICAVLIALGAYIIAVNKSNFSVILFALMLLGNIFTQKEKYDVEFISELMFSDKKKKNRVRHIAADAGCDLMSLAARFNRGSYTIVYFFDEDGKITETKTETEIISSLISTYSQPPP